MLLHTTTELSVPQIHHVAFAQQAHSFLQESPPNPPTPRRQEKKSPSLPTYSLKSLTNVVITVLNESPPPPGPLKMHILFFYLLVLYLRNIIVKIQLQHHFHYSTVPPLISLLPLPCVLAPRFRAPFFWFCSIKCLTLLGCVSNYI